MTGNNEGLWKPGRWKVKSDIGRFGSWVYVALVAPFLVVAQPFSESVQSHEASPAGQTSGLVVLTEPSVAGGQIFKSIAPEPPSRVLTRGVNEAIGNLPLYFIENRGQVDDRVKYYLHGRETSVYFKRDGITFALSGSEDATEHWAVELGFVDADNDGGLYGVELAKAVMSYFKGGRDEWKTGLPTYGEVVYRELWPGIDLVYSGNESRLKYTFVVSPGADPSRIGLVYRGATDVELTENGRLAVSTPLGGFEDDTPYAYQEIEGKRIEVPVSFALDSKKGDDYRYGFEVGAYDETKPLILDPVILAYCGYVGGSGVDRAFDIAVDGNRHAYITGYTESVPPSFPATPGGFDDTYNTGGDAFVAKIDVDGSALLYCGYIGGSNSDHGRGIAVDDTGAAYVTGYTSSDSDFPVTVGPDLTFNGPDDVFVAKVDPNGLSLDYCGYIGGSGTEYGYGIAVDTSGAAYVIGDTTSTKDSFPETGGPGLDHNGGVYDVFVAKVKPDGSSLDYCGYLGGSGNDYGADVAVDGSGRAYLTGSTQSGDLVTANPQQGSHAGGLYDAFVARVRPDGSGFDFFDYFGGGADDFGYGIAADDSGNTYIAGVTASTQAQSFPLLIGPSDIHGGGSVNGYDGFVAKLSNSGPLAYSGYIGGNGEDFCQDITLDDHGSAYVVGYTDDGTGFPIVRGPGAYSGLNDAFVAKLRPDGTWFEYSGFIGGTSHDYGYGIAVDAYGKAYVAGQTSSGDLPVKVGPDLNYNDNTDAFVAKVYSTADILKLVGFETGEASEINSLGVSATIDNATVRPGSGEFSLKQQDDPSILVQGIVPALDTLGLRFSFLKPSDPSPTDQLLVQFLDSALPSPIFSLWLRTDGTLLLNDDSGLGFAQTPGTTTLADNRWYTIRVTYDSSAGRAIRVWLVESQEIDVIHTNPGTPIDRIDVQGPTSAYSYDDFYLADSSNLPPRGQIIRLSPDGTDDSIGFSSSTGSVAVSEIPPADASFNAHTDLTVANDLYALQDFPFTTMINAVKGMWRMSGDTATDTHHNAWRENGIVQSEEFAGLTAAWALKETIWPESPYWNAPWSTLLVDDLQLGARHNTTLDQDTLISWTAAMVDYDAAAATSCLQIKTGSYGGNTSAGRPITGLGFQPDVVIVKADSAIEGVIRTATMTGTKDLYNSAPPQANRITSLDPDGFTVGNDATVNVSGYFYYWIAFEACGDMKVGTYVGSTIDNPQAVTGVGFSPEYVIVIPDTINSYARHRTRYGGFNSHRFRSGGVTTDSIPSLDADGFTVQQSASINDDMNWNGELYHYIAFNEVPGKVKVGEYRGDGNDNRDILGVGFQPDYLIVQSYLTTDEAYQKSTDMSGDASMSFFGALKADVIQALILDGFQVGADLKVNELSEDYAYVAFSTADTTAVELLSFTATGYDGEVLLEWETASEVDNLGFYLYRSDFKQGPYERVNEVAVPGLGSSPVGARYRYIDSGLTNGKTYYYELEDFEASGDEERHGPVSATPLAGVGLERGEQEPTEDNPTSRIAYGDPESIFFRVKRQNRHQIVLELETGGFYAEPRDDGTVHLSIPGFAEEYETGKPQIPVKRAWVDALAGRKIRIASVQAKDVQTFSLRPALTGEPVIEVSNRGALRASRSPRRGRGSIRSGDVYPEEPAKIVSIGFQEDVKKALLELAPLRWDESSGLLSLSRYIEVLLVLDGRVAEERSLGGSRGRRYRRRDQPTGSQIAVRLATRQPGLYGIRFEDVFGSSRRSLETSSLRLSRQGEAVAYRIEPNPRKFGPGTTLYFVSDGARLNPYGMEAVYELEVGREGEAMEEVKAPPSGASLMHYHHTEEVEQNTFVAITLNDEPCWLWDMVMSRSSKRYSFVVDSLAEVPESGELDIRILGYSSEESAPEIQAEVWVNGVLLAEPDWASDAFQNLKVEIPPGVLREGDNELVLENVSASRYTALVLDRYQVRYPRTAMLEDGALRGVFSQTGTANLKGVDETVHVVDVTDVPLWLTKTRTGEHGLQFLAEAEHEYLVVEETSVLQPEVIRARSAGLASRHNRADYAIVGPRDMLAVAGPLLELRRSQGLRTNAVAIEDVYAEFGHGEARPEAVADFLRYAYHEWSEPTLRYVVLLGDATYDFKNYLGAPETNQVLAQWEKTTWMWTASDPSYARVNGEDILPDIAIGRIPASTVEEARAMVEKIVAHDRSDRTLTDSIVLVADNPDKAGNFEADAEQLARTVLAGRNPTKIYLGQLGTAATRVEIRESLDGGASLMSYIGHGAVQMWAHENILDPNAIQTLLPQEKQPLVLTINCLNGFFNYPYFDALAEELLKAEGKGAVAVISPSGFSLNTPAHRFHKALLEELLGGKHAYLGDAILAAQARYAQEGSFLELLSIFHVFGDPCIRLR